jgi:hypothetical protein
MPRAKRRTGISLRRRACEAGVLGLPKQTTWIAFDIRLGSSTANPHAEFRTKGLAQSLTAPIGISPRSMNPPFEVSRGKHTMVNCAPFERNEMSGRHGARDLSSLGPIAVGKLQSVT